MTTFFVLLALSAAGILVIIVIRLSSLVGVLVGACRTTAWRITATPFCASLCVLGFCGQYSTRPIFAGTCLISGLVGVTSVFRIVILLLVVVCLSMLMIRARLFSFQMDFSRIILICHVVSVNGIFPGGLTVLLMSTAAFAFRSLGPDQFWRISHVLSLVLLPCSLLMKSVAALEAKELFTVQTLCCALLLLALFTNSEPFMSLLAHWIGVWFVLLPVAPSAKAGLTSDTSTIDALLLAILASLIQSLLP